MQLFRAGCLPSLLYLREAGKREEMGCRIGDNEPSQSERVDFSCADCSREAPLINISISIILQEANSAPKTVRHPSQFVGACKKAAVHYTTLQRPLCVVLICRCRSPRRFEAYIKLSMSIPPKNM